MRRYRSGEMLGKERMEQRRRGKGGVWTAFEYGWNGADSWGSLCETARPAGVHGTQHDES
jgi:hypothetical protein